MNAAIQFGKAQCAVLPMIPYINVPTFAVSSFSIDAEEILSVVGMAVAAVCAHRRATRWRIDARQLASFFVWLLVGAAIGGHLAEALCYRSDQIAVVSQGEIYWRQPSELLCVWDGWRSVGGFWGALLGALLWRTHLFQSTIWLNFSRFSNIEGYWFVRRERPQSILSLADVVLSVFPIAWAFNRLGSALTHDRPGVRASGESLFAVGYPSPNSAPVSGFSVIHGSVPRYDLGLLELFVTLLLLVAVVSLRKKSLRIGTYICLAGLTYAPARFGLDFLHPNTGVLAEQSYAALTPTQWGFAGLSLLSASMLLWIRVNPIMRDRNRSVDPCAPQQYWDQPHSG